MAECAQTLFQPEECKRTRKELKEAQLQRTERKQSDQTGDLAEDSSLGVSIDNEIQRRAVSSAKTGSPARSADFAGSAQAALVERTDTSTQEPASKLPAPSTGRPVATKLDSTTSALRSAEDTLESNEIGASVDRPKKTAVTAEPDASVGDEVDAAAPEQKEPEGDEHREHHAKSGALVADSSLDVSTDNELPRPAASSARAADFAESETDPLERTGTGTREPVSDSESRKSSAGRPAEATELDAATSELGAAKGTPLSPESTEAGEADTGAASTNVSTPLRNAGALSARNSAETTGREPPRPSLFGVGPVTITKDGVKRAGTHKCCKDKSCTNNCPARKRRSRWSDYQSPESGNPAVDQSPRAPLQDLAVARARPSESDADSQPGSQEDQKTTEPPVPMTWKEIRISRIALAIQGLEMVRQSSLV